MRFLIAGDCKVYRSGIVTLKEIDQWVKDYLVCDEEDLPADIAVPPRQMNFGEMDFNAT